MKEATLRGLNNTISLLVGSQEFGRLRTFLLADASAEKSEADDIVKHITDEIRAHLIAHGKAVREAQRARVL